MEDNSINGGGAKVTGIRQIVRLKEYLQKWQNATLSPKETCSNDQQVCSGISPEINRRLRTSSTHESDDDSCHSPEPSHGVPKGYLAVYVGPELRRFIIPTSYLSDPLFKVLLEKVEEEFGFDHSGALTIPCEVETFKYLLHCMENHQRDQQAGHHQSNADETVDDE